MVRLLHAVWRLAALVLCLASGATARPRVGRRSFASVADPPPVAHIGAYGADVSDELCQQLGRQTELAAVQAGRQLPYIFRGPEDQCSSLGCRHDYWGRRARYDGTIEPSCSLVDRRRMVAWLADLADRGSAWAAEALTFKPCDLWPQLRGRTIWVAGDSLSQDMAIGLASFMVEYQAASGRPLATNEGTLHTLTTSGSGGGEHPAWCFNMTADSRVCSLRANKAPRMATTVLRLLPELADRENDVLILNFGAWYNYNQETGNMPQLEADLRPFSEALQARLPELPRRTFWRESTAQHFATPTGMFDADKAIPEQRCAPAGSGLGVGIDLQPDGSLTASPGLNAASDGWQLQLLLSGGHRNRLTQPVMDSLGVRTLSLYNLSLAVHDVHRRYHQTGACVDVECDCTHACRPSWFQMFLPQLNWALRESSQQPVVPT